MFSGLHKATDAWQTCKAMGRALVQGKPYPRLLPLLVAAAGAAAAVQEGKKWITLVGRNGCGSRGKLGGGFCS